MTPFFIEWLTDFQCHFRYDQEGNVLFRSAVIHLKQDGRRSIFQVSFPGFIVVVTGVSLARLLVPVI